MASYAEFAAELSSTFTLVPFNATMSSSIFEIESQPCKISVRDIWLRRFD